MIYKIRSVAAWALRQSIDLCGLAKMSFSGFQDLTVVEFFSCHSAYPK